MNKSHGTLCQWTFLFGHRSNLRCHSIPLQNKRRSLQFSISSPLPSNSVPPHNLQAFLAFIITKVTVTAHGMPRWTAKSRTWGSPT